MRALRFFIPAFIWLIISVVLLTLPGTAFPQENWLDKIWMDKWIHVGMFAIMALLICWAISKAGVAIEKRRYCFILTGLICLGYGIIMEFVQLWFVAHRSFDIGDIIADGAGSFIGVWYSMKRYIKK
jgi:VanZ family protein